MSNSSSQINPHSLLGKILALEIFGTPEFAIAAKRVLELDEKLRGAISARDSDRALVARREEELSESKRLLAESEANAEKRARARQEAFQEAALHAPEGSFSVTKTSDDKGRALIFLRDLGVAELIRLNKEVISYGEEQ